MMSRRLVPSLLIRKLSIFLPFFRAATIHLGLLLFRPKSRLMGYDISVGPSCLS